MTQMARLLLGIQKSLVRTTKSYVILREIIVSDHTKENHS